MQLISNNLSKQKFGKPVRPDTEAADRFVEKLLENIKNEFNSYFDSKELDPIIFGAYFKAFAITTRG